MILQAFDFLELNKKKNCVLQIGRSDQWGNIAMVLTSLKDILIIFHMVNDTTDNFVSRPKMGKTDGTFG